MPEVETLVRDLAQSVVGREIAGAHVRKLDAVRFPPPADFVAWLAGRRVLAAQRRAKHILLPLSGDLLLAVHLMLWGTLTLTSRAQPSLPETMVIWHLDRDEDLRLSDKLGYARVALGSPAEVAERLDLDSLGPEILDEAFDAAALARQVGRRRSPIKTVLLNQKILAGLGNRDADESLWLAGIDPRRVAATLTPGEVERLHAAMRQVLAEGIALRGTQRDLFGNKGQAIHRRNIFERTGEPCPRCAGRVQHLRLGGRNTHYCATCQQ